MSIPYPLSNSKVNSKAVTQTQCGLPVTLSLHHRTRDVAVVNAGTSNNTNSTKCQPPEQQTLTSRQDGQDKMEHDTFSYTG